MKLKTALFPTVLFLLLQSSTAWSQVQWASPGYVGPQQAGYVEQPAYPGMQASHCDDCGNSSGSCGCSSGLGGLLGADGSSSLSQRGFWLDASYLLWWSKARDIPVLATTSPNGTPQAQAGVLGQPATAVLFGNSQIGDDAQSGFRVHGGSWLDSSRAFGVGGSYWRVGDEDDTLAASSNGDPILARPFFDTDSGAQDALLIAFPGIASNGSISIVGNNVASGYDFYLRKLLFAGNCNRFDLIGGYHGSTIEDELSITGSYQSDDPGGRVPVGTMVSVRDVFNVENQFHGGFVGLMAQADDGRLNWRTMAKVAFGNMNQEVSVAGTTTESLGGASAVLNGGLLAVPTNIGTVERDEFAIVPEINVQVGYKITNNFEVLLGYTFIYWSKVALAGEMVDTTVNATQLNGGALVGDNRPAVNIVDDGFWYTGLSVGGSVRF